MRRPWLNWPACLAAIVLFLGCAGPSLAHAVLIGSKPAAGEVVSVAPDRLELRFSEPVAPLAAQLLDSDGTTHALDDLAVEGSSVIVSLPALTGEGTRVVSWRAVSGDGHPISGAALFSIGAPSQTAPSDVVDADPAVAPLLWIVRTAMFIALFFGAGGAAFRMIASPLPGPARVICAVLVPVGLACTLAVVGLQGLDALGRPLTAMTDPEVWSVGLFTSYGKTCVAAALALVLGGVAALVRSARLAKFTSGAALVSIGTAVCLSGHASTAEPVWLMRSALFVHVTCIAWWIGALFPLAIHLRRGGSSRSLMRFSLIIPFAIVPLLISGTVLAVVQLGWPGPAWATPYGAILAAKLTLVVVLFSLASWNRWVLTRPAVGGNREARRHMRVSILGEVILVIAILGLVSGWRFTPPPRVLAAEAEQASPTLTLEDNGVVAAFSLGASGGATIELTDAQGMPLEVRAVVVALARPDLGIEPITTEAEKVRLGVWNAAGLTVPVPGDWLVEIRVRVSDFKLVRLAGNLDISS